LIIISVGILLLLSNLGIISGHSWHVLWRLWPVLLIALGLDVLIGQRSTIGAIISGVLMVALLGGALAVAILAPSIPGLAGLTQQAEPQTEHVEHPLGGVERASVSIDWTGAPGTLDALRDSPNLIEADVVYRGDLIFDVDVRDDQADVKLDSVLSGPWFGLPEWRSWREEQWDVKLSPEVKLSLALDTGSGTYEFDLSELQVSALSLDSGSGAVALTLPASTSFDALIDSGSGPLAIAVPKDVGARVVLDDGSGIFDPGERFRLVEGEPDGDGIWETRDFGTAEHTILIEIDQGSGPVRIR
jgi:hypothetical protein